MKKFLILAVITAFYLHPSNVFAQKKNKAERAFVTELNTVLNKSEKQDGDYEGVMTIDSAFAINAAGVLAVTVKYTSDSSITRVRLAAPVSSIQKVLYDLYLILECADEQVQLSESKNGAPLKEVSKGSWFRVGAPLPENIMYRVRVEKALKQLLAIYK
ncbi:MAG: hypothetical protein H7296_02905 [Bacteroidia bacterium]|nr:hypothetical protein [Bacteroidia bacterium]